MSLLDNKRGEELLIFKTLFLIISSTENLKADIEIFLKRIIQKFKVSWDIFCNCKNICH